MTVRRNVRGALAVGVLLVLLAAGRAAQAAEKVPYADAQAIGFITLYDKAGKAVKGGSVQDRPFVGKAVGSAKPPAPYDSAGRKVTLAAFQPRNGALPASWSADLLTRAVAYPDADHPTVEATPDALSLQEFMDQFPPKWNGLIQLRMLASMPNQSPLTTQYASTDIKVTGRTWTVVGGGPGAGSGGANIPGVPGPGAAAGAGGGKGAAGDAGLAGGGGLPDRNPIAAILPGVGVPGTLAIAAAVIVGLVLAGVFWRRRRYGAEEGENPSG
jgi:hypothetical protein